MPLTIRPAYEVIESGVLVDIRLQYGHHLEGARATVVALDQRSGGGVQAHSLASLGAGACRLLHPGWTVPGEAVGVVVAPEVRQAVQKRYHELEVAPSAI